MACLWAARLWELPNIARVSLLLRRQSAVEDLQEAGGVRLHEAEMETLAAVQGQHIPLIDTAISYLLVCTKAQDAEKAIASVAHCFTPDTKIVLLQNGIKMQQHISQAYPSHKVYALSTSQGAYLHAPFDVVHAGFGQSYLGLLSPSAANESTSPDTLLHALPVQRMNIHWDANITSRLWIKFAINCAINALTVIYNCKNGELLHHPQSLRTLRALCEEIQLILNRTPTSPSIDNLFQQVEAVLLATAENISSTLQDARKGQPSEFIHFNPYLCELAQSQKIENPVNEQVIARFSTSFAKLAD